MASIVCPGCQRAFPLQRSFPVHLSRSACCQVAFQNQQQEATDLSLESLEIQDGDSQDSSAHFHDQSMHHYDSSPNRSMEVQPQRDMNLPQEEDTPLDEDGDQSDHQVGYLNFLRDSMSVPEDSLYEEEDDNPAGNSQLVVYGPSPPPFHTDSGAIEHTLLQQLELYKSQNYQHMPNSPSMMSQMDLLVLLQRAKAPLGLYDELIAWMNRSRDHYRYKFDQTTLSQSQLLNHLYTRFDMHGLKPYIKRLYLPGAKVEVDLVVHDFLQGLYSLLNNPILMHPDNLLLDPEDPYGPPPEDKSIVGDIHTGDRYRRLYVHYRGPDGRVVVCSLILFGDKTHTDQNGNLCMEPYSFTLGIFNRATRMRPDAWRILGYVKNQGVLPKTSTPLDRAKDYHLMMKEILGSLVAAQGRAGIEWELELNGTVFPVVFRIPVIFIIGDNEGHDKMCGRYLGPGKASGCRICDIRSEDLGDETYHFKHTRQVDIEKMVQKMDKDGLQGASQHLLYNAFYELDLGPDPRGLHGSTPPDFLHSVQFGPNVYACKGLFLQKRVPKKKKKNQDNDTGNKITKKANDEEDSDVPYAEVYESLDAAEYSKYTVFGGKLMDKVDIWARKYGQILPHQSDRDLPRCCFSQTITTMAKFSAHEVQGIMIVLLLILCSRGGQEIEESMGAVRHASYVSLLEKLLMMEEYLKQSEFKRSNVKEVKKYMPLLLDLFTRTVNRQEGTGDGFLKYHLPLHFCDFILEFGSPQNTDSGVGEHNHIFHIKHNSRKTQRRASTLDYQTGTRYTESVATDSCKMLLPELEHSPIASPTNSGGIDVPGPVGSDFKGSKRFFGREEGIFEIDGHRRRMAMWADDSHQERVLAFVKEHILPCVHGDEVELLTQCKRSGITFKGHPGRRGVPAWRDWALFDWGAGNEIPGHIMLFVNLTNLKEAIHVNDSVAEDQGYYAIIESLPTAIDPTDDQQRPVPQSELLLWGSKNPCEEPMAIPKLCLATVESIVKPTVAVPYDVDGDSFPHDYIFMYERSSWPERFLKRVRATNSGNEYSH